MQINVAVTGANREEDFLLVDIKPEETLAVFKERVEFQTGIPPSQQTVNFNGQNIVDVSKTLEQCQITADSMLYVIISNPQRPAAAQRAPAPQNQGQRGQPSPPDPEMLRQGYLSSPTDMSRLRNQMPLLADVINDPAQFKSRYEDFQRRQKDLQAQREKDMALLEADPFDVEAQARIEELIRLERVDENYAHTQEYHPEAFGRVNMLYIPVQVNAHTVLAFVDSGAQSTIMSPSCASRCGIMRLLDTRFSGIARGVGTAKILGRVHSAPIKIGSSFLPCAFTVMEGKDVELLLGLDMLKRYQGCIDLERNVLRMRGDEVPFLGEADIPKEEVLRAEEPTFDGPGGSKIGGISGAVKGPEQSEMGSQGQGGATAAAPAGPSSAQQPAPAAAGSVTAGGAAPSSFPEADIARLTDMGMARAEAIQALTLANGDVETAAGLMF